MRQNATNGIAERDEQQPEAERPELGQGLDVETVGVPHLERGLALANPEALVAAGAGSDEGMRAKVVPGDLPEVGSAVSGEVQQAIVQIRPHARRRRLERRVSLRDERRRAAEADEDERGGDDDRGEQRRAVETLERQPRPCAPLDRQKAQHQKHLDAKE